MCNVHLQCAGIVKHPTMTIKRSRAALLASISLRPDIDVYYRVLLHYRMLAARFIYIYSYM
jgi:hypothetical protein